MKGSACVGSFGDQRAAEPTSWLPGAVDQPSVPSTPPPLRELNRGPEETDRLFFLLIAEQGEGECLALGVVVVRWIGNFCVFPLSQNK